MRANRRATGDEQIAPRQQDNGFAWLRDGSARRLREDRIAEAVALAALLFSLGVGFVIALLPVSVEAAAAVADRL
jgi:hypothetical protein